VIALRRKTFFAGLLLSSTFLLTSAWSVAQTGGFEGSVEMTMHTNGETIPVTYALKGHKVRVEMQAMGRANVILIDLVADTQTILIPELKAYAVHTSKVPAGEPAATALKVADLKTTDTVAGHACENYHLENEKFSGTACLTKEFGENPLTDAMEGPLGAQLKGDETLRKAGMPLKMVLTFKDGKRQGEQASVEVSKVAPGPVEDSALAIPDGWHKLSGLPGLQ
jgi:hypothetical protein